MDKRKIYLGIGMLFILAFAWFISGSNFSLLSGNKYDAIILDILAFISGIIGTILITINLK